MTTEIATTEIANPTDDFLQPIPQQAVPSQGGGGGAYVAFYGKKSEKNLEDLAAAGITEGTFYLMDGQPRKVEPFQLHLLQYFKAYTKQNLDTGELLEAAYTEDGSLDEHIEALVLVVLPTDKDSPSVFVPANLRLRKAQAAALRPAINLYEGTAKSPKDLLAWGPEYRFGAECPIIGGRFRTQIRSELTMPRQGKNMYNLGKGVVLPTPEKDVKPLETYVRGVGAPRLLAAAKAFDSRVANIKAMIG